MPIPAMTRPKSALLDRLFTALADDGTRALAGSVHKAKAPVSSDALVQTHQVAPAKLQRGLRQLVECGLVDRKRTRRGYAYSPSADGMSTAAAWFKSFLSASVADEDPINTIIQNRSLFYKAVKSAAQREVLRFIANEGVADQKLLIRRTGLAQSTVSRHLVILARLSLINIRRDKDVKRYTLAKAGIETYWPLFRAFDREVLKSPSPLVPRTHPTVSEDVPVAACVDDGADATNGMDSCRLGPPTSPDEAPSRPPTLDVANMCGTDQDGTPASALQEPPPPLKRDKHGLVAHVALTSGMVTRQNPGVAPAA